jgi:hypothetical protein
MSIKAISPAMRYRLGLKFDRLDVRKSDICFACTTDKTDGVFVSMPALGEAHRATDDRWNRMRAAANEMWQQRFGCTLPDNIEATEAEDHAATLVRWMPDSGMRKLSAEELDVTSQVCDNGYGFSLDMLWLLVEGLGWTLGKPVPYTDPGWLAVWAEEEERVLYMDIVCAALGMHERELIDGRPLMPIVVAQAYAEAGIVQSFAMLRRGR